MFRNERVLVRGDVVANGDATSGVRVALFDAEPFEGGTIQDVDILSHIRASETHHFQMPFRPTTSGDHELVLVAEPGDGGVYVGNSTELLHFTDTDGDGKADRKRVVLSGFGTEDTHHIIHTLRWGPQGNAVKHFS